MTDGATLVHVYDPMCSWCWAYRPEWTALRGALPADLTVVELLGGLAPDSDEPMPPETRAMVQGHWRRIEGLLGTAFNHDFWTACSPRRDTYKACRAVVAAGERGPDMVLAIQEAYYLRAMNPSEPDTLVQLAGEIGLDQEVFAALLAATETDIEFRRQRDLARQLGVGSYPSLVLLAGQEARPIPVDYRDHRVTLAAIQGA